MTRRGNTFDNERSILLLPISFLFFSFSLFYPRVSRVGVRLDPEIAIVTRSDMRGLVVTDKAYKINTISKQSPTNEWGWETMFRYRYNWVCWKILALVTEKREVT